jgi:hypothetical protein
MTRSTLTEFAKKTDAEIAGYSIVETSALEAHVRQANEAQAAIATLEAIEGTDEYKAKRMAEALAAKDAAIAAVDQAEQKIAALNP